jgi:hypothetical protein
VHQHVRKILHAFFAHPIAANIDFKDAEHALTALGGELENKHGNKVELTLQGKKLTLHKHHTLSREEVVQLRKFLESCGISGESFA